MILSLTFCYYIRLEKQSERKMYFKYIANLLRNNVVSNYWKNFDNILDYVEKIQEDMIQKFKIPEVFK